MRDLISKMEGEDHLHCSLPRTRVPDRSTYTKVKRQPGPNNLASVPLFFFTEHMLILHVMFLNMVYMVKTKPQYRPTLGATVILGRTL